MTIEILLFILKNIISSKGSLLYCWYMGNKINSRNKGAKGERELAKYLSEKGYPSRRGQQFSGGKDSPDVVSSLPFHIECKRVERLKIYDSIKQAIRDSQESEKMPLVVHRKNREEWLAILKLDDLLTLMDEIIDTNL